MNFLVGSYEAKTKLPELLRGVQSGKHYTITLRARRSQIWCQHKAISVRALRLLQKICATSCARVSQWRVSTSRRSLMRGVPERLVSKAFATRRANYPAP